MPAWATAQPVGDAGVLAQATAAEAARNADDDALRALVTLLNGYVDTLEAKLTPPLLVEPGPGAEFTLTDGTIFSVTDLPLPAGAATDAKVEALRALVAAGVPLDPATVFSVTDLPLPDGAASSAKQDLTNDKLDLLVAATVEPKGYEQITGITGSTVKALTGAVGARFAVVTAKVAGRWRDDGTDPTSTVGQPIAAGQPYRFDQADLTDVRFIVADTLDVSYYA